VGDGKTFVASNLALALANAGQRVVLVDANFRRPAVHAWFGVPNASGLAQALDLAAGWPAAPRGGKAIDVPGVVASSRQNLWLLPAGTSTADHELLGSDALGRVVDRLERDWDTVVLDGAPIGPVSDALILAHHARSCLVVARCERTRRAALRGALAALRAAGPLLVGVVLNDERSDPLARFGHYDHYHHGDWTELPPAEADGAATDRHNGLGHQHTAAQGMEVTP